MQRTNSHRTLNAPPSSDTFANTCLVHLQASAPFTQALSHTASSQPSVAPSVLILHSLGRPSHIANFVMPIIINAVKRMSWGRPASYMVKKCLVRGKFKFDATLAIIFKVFVNSGATALSSAVCSIFSRIARTYRFSVSQRPARCITGLEASTGLRQAADEVLSGNNFRIATLANAFPILIIRWGDAHES